MADVLTVELSEAGEAEQLVRYLERRELDSAKRVECNDVAIALPDAPGHSRLAVLVALEGWLIRKRRALLVLRLGRRRYRLHPHPDAARA